MIYLLISEKLIPLLRMQFLLKKVNDMKPLMKKRQKSSTAISENGETGRFMRTETTSHLTVRTQREDLSQEDRRKNERNVSQAERLVRRQEKNSSQTTARLRNQGTKNRLARVAKTFEMTDVHAEMESDLLINLADRKAGIVRFQEKRVRRSKKET